MAIGYFMVADLLDHGAADPAAWMTS